jgi:hypothetical protein
VRPVLRGHLVQPDRLDPPTAQPLTQLNTRGINEYIVEFDRPATECVATATLTLDEGATNLQPQPGYVTVSREGPRWVARTYDTTGGAVSRAFNIIAAC